MTSAWTAEIGELEPRLRRLALAVAIAMNIGFLVALDRMMAASAVQLPASPGRRMELRVIELTLPAEPVPAPKQIPASTASAPTQSKPSPTAKQTTAPIVTAPPMLNLFAPDGRVLLPAQADSSTHASTEFPTTPPKPATRNPFERRDLLPYTRGRFENAWAAPTNESLGAKAMRKFYSHRWTTPWGMPVACEQGTPTAETPIVIECRSGASNATSEELRAMRADPPPPKPPSVAGPAVGQ